MNRIIATTGLAALGAVALQPAAAQEKDTKPWNITGTVRSFYDDNYLTQPKGGKRASYGLELSPAGAYKLTRDQTTLDLSSRYGMRYYEDRKENSADHSFDFNANLEHRFTEKQTLTVSDSFAVAQEPGVLDPVATTFLRTPGNNFRNNILFGYRWEEIIERWALGLSYSNTYYDYEQDNSSSGLPGSRSALLDRVEHLFTVAGTYRIFDETSTELGLGYSFGVTGSTSKDALDAAGNLPTTRDSRSHYFFTGVGHKFTPELKIQSKFGVQYVEYPNAAKAAPVFQKSQTSPYVDAAGSWDYQQNSSVQLGVRIARNTTDITTSVDAQSTTVYGSVNHEFTPDLKGSLLAQYQLSEFRQTAGVRDVADNVFTTGINLEWRFHQFISLEGGYNYDRQDADLAGRSYYRNRVYVGFKGTW
ncbi:MAG: outer membrane beta-barrel protein [Limisphaerales bacterium]